MNKKSLRGTEEDCWCRDISYIWVYREVSVLLSSFRHKSLEQQNSSAICSFLYHSYCWLFILILLFSSILALSFVYLFLGSVYSLQHVSLVIIFKSSLFFLSSSCCVLLLSASDSLHTAAYSEIRNMFWIKLFIFHSTSSWLTCIIRG